MLDRPDMPKCAKDIHKRAHKKTRRYKWGKTCKNVTKYILWARFQTI